jgi:hypothetical protein
VSQHRLYYFGRTCLFIFIILFAEGLALPYMFQAQSGTPPIVARYVGLMSLLLPWAAPVGVAAAVGLMRRQEWARKVLCGLFLGAVAIALWFVIGMVRLMGSDAIGAAVAGGILMVGLFWAARQVITVPFEAP